MIRFQTFGTIDLRREDGERLDALLGQPKRLALLAVLAVRQPAGPVRREKLVSLLWPDSSPSSARAALSTTLSRLRNALGEGVLRGRGEESIGLSEDHVRSDVATFQTAYGEERYRAAVELYEGPFLEGFRPPEARPFEEWMARRRDEYGQQAYRAAMEAAGKARSEGDLGPAEACLRKACEIEPLREEPVQGLVTLLADRGDRATAVQLYRQFCSRLEEKVGLSPSDAFKGRVRALQSGSDGRTDEPHASSPEDTATEVAGPGREPPGTSAPGPSDRGRSGGTAKPFALRPSGVLLIGTVLLTALTGLLLFVTGGMDESTPAVNAGTTSAAVLPFQVSGGASETWRDGMVTLLSTGLDGAVGLRAVADRTVLAAWEQRGSAEGGASSQKALAVARQVGARYAVIGSAVEVGGELRLTASVHETASGEQVDQVGVRGSPGGMPALGDTLTRHLLEVLLEKGGGRTPSVDLASQTTGSLPALKAFLAGERHFRRADFESAIDAYGRALDRDSTFALAHWQLARAYGWRPETAAGKKARRHRHRTFKLASQLPEREQRLVRADYLSRNGRPQDAADSLRTLSRIYPEDPEVWYFRGEVTLHFSQPPGWPAADDYFGRAVALDSAFAPYHIHRVDLAFALHADSALAARRIAAHPTLSGSDPRLQFLEAAMFGDSAERAAAFTGLDSVLTTNLEWLSALSTLHPARPELRAAIDRELLERDDISDPREPVVPLVLSAFHHRGQVRKGLRRLRQLGLSPAQRACLAAHAQSVDIPIPDSVRPRALDPGRLEEVISPESAACIGLFAAAKGRAEVIDRALVYLREEVPQRPDTVGRQSVWRPEAAGTVQRLHALLRGYRSLAEGRPRQAVQLLSQAQVGSFYRPTGLWLGDAHRLAGNLEKAEGWYLGSWHLPLAHLRLGQLYEEMGRTEDAAAAYRRFTNAWEDADPDLQNRVEAARKRLKELSTFGVND